MIEGQSRTAKNIRGDFLRVLQNPHATPEELVQANRDFEKAFNFVVGLLRQRSRINNPQVAEDVAQEALLRAYHKIDMLQDMNAFSSWVMQIAINLARDTLRLTEEDEKRMFSLQEPIGGSSKNRLGDILADPTADQAFHEVEMADQYEEFGLLAMSLTELQYTAVTAKYWGYSDNELIKACNTNRNAFQRMRHRGKEQLQKKIMHSATKVGLQDDYSPFNPHLNYPEAVF